MPNLKCLQALNFFLIDQVWKCLMLLGIALEVDGGVFQECLGSASGVVGNVQECFAWFVII